MPYISDVGAGNRRRTRARASVHTADAYIAVHQTYFQVGCIASGIFFTATLCSERYLRAKRVLVEVSFCLVSSLRPRSQPLLFRRQPRHPYGSLLLSLTLPLEFLLPQPSLPCREYWIFVSGDGALTPGLRCRNYNAFAYPTMHTIFMSCCQSLTRPAL